MGHYGCPPWVTWKRRLVDERAVFPTPPTGDHKGPPHIHPTALAPTRDPTILRLMRIRADKSAMGAKEFKRAP